MSSAPIFTIFIPTYNRAHLLLRALVSIEGQTFRDFEVIIVDDGSTDETASVVADWIQRVDFPVKYHPQINQGKHVAHNVGVGLARGQFFVNLDSDDRLLPDTLERLLRQWQAIPENERDDFAGVEGLIESMDGERIVTPRYPESPLHTDYLTVRYTRGIGGDKKGFIRTDILQKYSYPVFPGEKHCRESLVWKRMAHRYQFRYVNEVFQQVEYQPGGLSSDCFRLRMSTIKGFQLYYLEDLTLHWAWLDSRQQRRSTVEYIRFSLHDKISPIRQFRETGYSRSYLAFFPLGIMRWLVDIYRIKIRKGQVPNRRVKP